MPKDRSMNPLSSSLSRVSPYRCGSSGLDNKKLDTSLPPLDESDWEAARCPVCMEHPHNAVLLICSSQEKGCRPYMCNTSHRHSNCLDQYRKLIPATSSTARPDDEAMTWMLYGNSGGRERLSQPNSSSEGQALDLICPLCRGQISGWIVVGAARKYMDAKVRSCSMESCVFVGAYDELRKHARSKHPSIRPSEADPQRQSEWARLERQRDLGDTLSAYQSQFELDGDDPLAWYDLDLDDNPFEEQWLGDALLDDFFSGIHSECDEETMNSFMSADLSSEVELRDTLSGYQSQFELDGDDPLAWYDLDQDDNPFEEQWLSDASLDDFFSRMHSESDEETIYSHVPADLDSDVELSFSFFNDSSLYHWDEDRSFASARTRGSLLNRFTGSRSRSSNNYDHDTVSRNWNGSLHSRQMPDFSRPTPPSRQIPSPSRPAAPSRHMPSSSRPTGLSRHTPPTRHTGNSMPPRYRPSSLRSTSDAPNYSTGNVSSRHVLNTSRSTASSRHPPNNSHSTAPSSAHRRQLDGRR